MRMRLAIASLLVASMAIAAGCGSSSSDTSGGGTTATGSEGGSSLPTSYELTVENQIHADGAATVVFIDMEKQKAMRIPENIRNLISKGIQ